MSLPRLARAVPLGFILVALNAGYVAAQENHEPMIQEALRHIQSQEYERAVGILRTVTEQEPENARAWSLLGFALHSAGRLDEAMRAHLKATQFAETAPLAMYNLGLAYALQGMPDSAFAWLFKARDTGLIDMTQIHFDSDSESLREDPRYSRLFPSPDELADPFVEDMEIIREWRGEATGDQFGWIARNIGDVDGDRIEDVATSAPFKSENAGKVYVYSSGSGELLWSRAGAPGERLGLGIEAAGDVNHDGIPDVIAGAPGADKTYVYSGRDGTVLMTLYAHQEGELFGRKVSDLGDVDGDGHADVVVGAPQNDDAGEDAGRAYVISGQTGKTLLTLSGEQEGDAFGRSVSGFFSDSSSFLVVGAPNAGREDRGRVYVYTGMSKEPAFVIEADETGHMLGGMFVSVVGDVNADGVPDIYASDWSNNARGRSTGRIYIHSGADGGRLLALTGEGEGDGFGIGTGDAGDVNDDGHADLIIGAWQYGGAAPNGGKVYLYSGADGSLLRAYTGKVPGETFGFDATGLGDVNGDGVEDFLLTSAWSSVNGPRSGRVWVISGNR